MNWRKITVESLSLWTEERFSKSSKFGVANKLKDIVKKIVEKSKQIETLEKTIQENRIFFVKEVKTKFETFEKNQHTMKVCFQ